MNSKFSLKDFKKKFGTHEKCLEALKLLRFPDPYECPKCELQQKFYAVKGRTAYACNNCGHHIYPLAGTIFEKSSTPLDLWFFAMYLMVQTRSGTSAKQLERMLGVTYKTAWRMFKHIRMLMNEGGGKLLSGDIEIDETYIGGKGVNKRGRWTQGIDGEQKEVVMGMLQREGKVYLKHIPNSGKWTLLNQIRENIDPKARIITDEYRSYTQLPKYGFTHDTVNHKHEYVNYFNNDIHTNNIECMWGNLKRGITGVYRIVSKKYLQAYVDEYAWRFNNRYYKGEMFDKLLSRVISVKVLQPSLTR